MLSASFSLSSLSSTSEDEKDEPNKKRKKKQSKKSSLASSTISDLALQVAKNNLSDYDDEEDEEEDYEEYQPRHKHSIYDLKKGRNVDKACNHCKRSHLRCDNTRPCRRCVVTGKTGCQDVLHKQRGRPRLQKKK